MTLNLNHMTQTLDLCDGRVFAAMDDREVEDRDYTPVPREYWEMSFSEVVEDIREHALEMMLSELARLDIPQRWM